MSKDYIIYEEKDNKASITLNRPDVHNAFNEDVIDALTQVFMEVGQKKHIQTVLLQARGKSFSAGADLEWMKRMANYSFEENVKDSMALAILLKTIDSCSKTTIAIVDGAAYGGGVGLICACDLALATERASFCLSEVKLGLIPAVISPYVIRAIGSRQTRRLALSAERIDVHEALALGLVTHFTHEEELRNKEDYLLKLIDQGSCEAQKETKDLIFTVEGRSIDLDLLQETAQRIAKIRASDDAKAGIDAFLRSRVSKN